jgi:hypothetical protein
VIGLRSLMGWKYNNSFTGAPFAIKTWKCYFEPLSKWDWILWINSLLKHQWMANSRLASNRLNTCLRLNTDCIQFNYIVFDCAVLLNLFLRNMESFSKIITSDKLIEICIKFYSYYSIGIYEKNYWTIEQYWNETKLMLEFMPGLSANHFFLK